MPSCEMTVVNNRQLLEGTRIRQTSVLIFWLIKVEIMVMATLMVILRQQLQERLEAKLLAVVLTYLPLLIQRQ